MLPHHYLKLLFSFLFFSFLFFFSSFFFFFFFFAKRKSIVSTRKWISLPRVNFVVDVQEIFFEKVNFAQMQSKHFFFIGFMNKYSSFLQTIQINLRNLPHSFIFMLTKSNVPWKPISLKRSFWWFQAMILTQNWAISRWYQCKTSTHLCMEVLVNS